MGRSVVQHWLLNLAIEVPCSLGTIFPSVEEEYLNVKKIAGCKPEEYGESLLELFEEGSHKSLSFLCDYRKMHAKFGMRREK